MPTRGGKRPPAYKYGKNGFMPNTRYNANPRSGDASGTRRATPTNPLQQVDRKINESLTNSGAKPHPRNLGAESDGAREQQGQVAATAAQIQYRVPGLGLRPLERHALPNPVLPQAQPVVEPVVGRGNALEASADGGGVRAHQLSQSRLASRLTKAGKDQRHEQ